MEMTNPPIMMTTCSLYVFVHYHSLQGHISLYCTVQKHLRITNIYFNCRWTTLVT